MTGTPTRNISLVMLLALTLFAHTGCGGPTPEAAGDECDPDGDPCPSGTVCAPGGEDHICQIEPGNPCNPAGEDFCLGDSVCGETPEGDGVCGIPEGGECDPAEPYCTGDLLCEEVAGGGHACFPPLHLGGRVFDATTDEAVAGAHVLALDDSASAVTDVAVTDVDGNYDLVVPVPRNDDGSPVDDAIYTLRASAADYQTFPGGVRPALPIDSGEAVSTESGWSIESAVTDVALIPLPEEEQGQTTIEGNVLAEDRSGGVLVVAEGSDGGISAVSDKSGAYTIFNVPDGSYEVRGYAANVQLTPESVEVAGAPVVDVDLIESGDALGSIDGSIQIVNAPGGSLTSVVLVVESTFSETFVKGEVPLGLRAPLSGPPDVSGGFVIEGVPAGDYVVLASFENDGLVRDPDQAIAGTGLVRVTMPGPGEAITLDESFKVTEALAVLSPGADEPEPVSGNVTLRWADDSSEKFYTVTVYDAYGDLVWCRARADVLALLNLDGCDDVEVPEANGGDVSVAYDGPLDPGMYYQFRATSWREPGGGPTPISQTEDLRGVFYVE